MSKDYNLKISTDKTKIIALKGKHLVCSKIEIDGSILGEVKRFNYLGCGVSLDGDPDFDKKNKQIPQNMRHYYKTSKENRYRHPNEILQSCSQTNTTVRYRNVGNHETRHG
jgi:hypothetical protein